MSEAQGKIVLLFTKDMGNGESYQVDYPISPENWRMLLPHERDSFVAALYQKYKEPYADCTARVVLE